METCRALRRDVDSLMKLDARSQGGVGERVGEREEKGAEATSMEGFGDESLLRSAALRNTRLHTPPVLRFLSSLLSNTDPATSCREREKSWISQEQQLFRRDAVMEARRTTQTFTFSFFLDSYMTNTSIQSK